MTVAFYPVYHKYRVKEIFIKVKPDEYLSIIKKQENPLVIMSRQGIPRYYRYLIEYKGYKFYSDLDDELEIADNIELINAVEIPIY